MLPKSINKNDDFKKIYKVGKKIVSKQFIFYYYENDHNYDRIGFTVSNKMGKSVTRSKLKRKLREVFRLKFTETKKGYDFVLVARNKLKFVTYQQLDKEFNKVYKQFKKEI